MQYDNIIVGGGVAGLICGGYLAGAGQKTIILEAKERPGGRITSHKFEGYQCTLHAITHHPGMGEGGFWFAAAKALGAKVKLLQVPASAMVWWRGEGMKYQYKPYKNIQEMMVFAETQSPEPLTDASKNEFPKVLEEILNWDFMRLSADLDEVYLRDYLNERTKNPQIQHFFYNLAGQMINMDYEDVKAYLGAGKTFTIFRQWLNREGPFCIPEKGTTFAEAINKPFADAFVSHGGELSCDSRVRKVLVEGGKAKGVLVGDREYQGKRVIVNCPFPSIPRIIDPLPPEVAVPVQELKKVEMLDVIAFSGLDKPMTDEPRWIAAQDPKDWSWLLGVQPYSLTAPWAAPPGKHLFWAEKPYRRADFKKKDIKDCYKEIDDIQEEIWPGFKDSIVDQRHYSHPLLWHHQYSALKKIPQKSESISDLYFIGDGTTPQYGTGTDGAASTGVNVAKQILGKT